MDPNQENLDGQHLIQHCVMIRRDKNGYGLTVTGDNPVYVQSVKEDGAAYRTGVQVGDRIIKVNGTLVTHYNHIEVVRLIKSGSYVALTLLGKPPVHPEDRPGSSSRPAIQAKDPVREATSERIESAKRVLAQEQQFYKKTKEEYMKKPSEKLQKELAQSTTRIKAFEQELTALTQPSATKSSSSVSGPASPPPGKPTPAGWQSPRLSTRSYSTPSDDSPSPTPSLDSDSSTPLYDNYPVPHNKRVFEDTTHSEAGRVPARHPQLSATPSVSPPQPPERKKFLKDDQLPLPEGPTHVRQHSSPDAFFRPMNSGSFKKNSLREGGRKKSWEDMTGMPGMQAYAGLAIASPSTTRKNLLPSTLPRGWNPRIHDGRSLINEDLTMKGANPSSPPPTPTLVEPQRSGSETSDIYCDNDDDDQSVSAESNKLDIPHHQSQVSIISMEEGEFSDDEKIEDHGPFNDLGVLKNKPAHLAVFLHYLISNSDPASLFFWLVTESYKEGTPREMKKWSYEIYSTFLADSAPLRVEMDREKILQPIEDLLGSEDNLKNLFDQARAVAVEEIGEFLADFRNKRDLGLGSLFGDHQLEDDNMDKVKELQVVEQTLMPHLESVMADLESNKSADPATNDRNSAMASALTTFMKQVGLTVKAGNNANILERYSSFTRKENKAWFKMKNPSKKIKGHNFFSTHYTSLTFCNYCHGLLWGIGDQGFQCSSCEYNVHKGSCYDSVDDCKKKKEKKPNPTNRAPSVGTGLNSSVRKFSQQSPNHTSTVHINLNNSWNHENTNDDTESDNGSSEIRKQKSGSFDDKLIGHGRDIRDMYIGSGEEGMSRIASTSDLSPPDKRNVVARSISMRTPKEISAALRKPGRRSVAGTADAFRDGDGLPFRSLDNSGLDTVSEDARRARSRSPFLSAEEEPDPDMDVEAQPIPWQQIVDKKILRKLKTKEIKRQEFIHELIHTERHHVRNLKVLDKVFYRPMRKEDVMSYDQIKELFPNLNELIDIHSSLMKSMIARQGKPGDVVNCIGDVMLERFDGDPGLIAKEAFATFCNRQKFALEHLKYRQRKEPKLQQLIANCENHPLCRRLTLQAIISTSYQRLTKYPLLLEGIQKNTPSVHADSKDTERAIQCCKDLLAFVNQSVKDCENQQRLLDFQRKIDKRPLENANNSILEEFKNLDFTKKKLVHDGPLTWRISRTKSVDLHALLLEDLLILLQKQDDKLVLKCLNPALGSKYQDNKNAHSPIIKLNSVLTRNVATDKRAFFLVSTSSVGPQIYELVTTDHTQRKTWFKYITDTAEAFKGKERGRRFAVSIEGPRSVMDVGDVKTLSSRRVVEGKKEEDTTTKEKEKSEEEDRKEEDEDEDEGDKDNDTEDEESDEGYTEEGGQEEEEEEETEAAAPPTEEQVPPPIAVEPPPEQAPHLESESDTEYEPDTETESVFTPTLTKEESEVQSEASCQLPATAESSPPSDSETDVQSVEGSEALSGSVLTRKSLAEITNEESVDDRSMATDRSSIISESSSSSSNDTLKMKGSLLHMSPDDHEESVSAGSARSSIMLLELLRSKDAELRKILEEKARIVAELRGTHVTIGASTSESHTNGDSLEAKDLILDAILEANRLTLAVSEVSNPSEEVLSWPQLVSSTAVLNEQLTTVYRVITERDMARDRLRCDLQFANSQIQRLKQGRSSSRRSRELPSQLSLNNDHFAGGLDSPRPCSPTSTVDLDSDYARLSEASDCLASEDNMEPVGRSSSFSGYRHRSSLASSGYRSSTASSRQTWRSREETGASWRRGGRASNTAYWSDEAEYESQSQI